MSKAKNIRNRLRSFRRSNLYTKASLQYTQHACGSEWSQILKIDQMVFSHAKFFYEINMWQQRFFKVSSELMHTLNDRLLGNILQMQPSASVLLVFICLQS